MTAKEKDMGTRAYAVYMQFLWHHSNGAHLKGDENTYRDEVEHLVGWCSAD